VGLVWKRRLEAATLLYAVPSTHLSWFGKAANILAQAGSFGKRHPQRVKGFWKQNGAEKINPEA